MTTLAAFILERFDEDEAAAAQAVWLDKEYDAGPHHYAWAKLGSNGSQLFRSGAPSPVRVLADIAGKRLLVNWIFRDAEEVDGEYGCGHSADQIRAGECDSHGQDQAIRPLRMLAIPYSDHTDFDPGWAV